MFITFEGLDGAGKSTQIERLRHTFLAQGRNVIFTREPGGTDIGDAIREMLLNPGNRVLAARTEALLYAASRAQLLYEVILPALSRGDIVLCDRYVDASLAYQGAGLALGVDEVAQMNAFATNGLTPELTFLMDIPVETSQTRVMTSRADTGPDRIERRSTDYFARVRAQFLRIAEDEPNRVVVLDATLPADVIEQEIWSIVTKRI